MNTKVRRTPALPPRGGPLTRYFSRLLRPRPTMTLRFPNPSRNFDAPRNGVGFYGHDGVFEIRFFVEAAALAGSASRDAGLSEDQCLRAFDSLREPIEEAARKAYVSSGRNSYVLRVADIR